MSKEQQFEDAVRTSNIAKFYTLLESSTSDEQQEMLQADNYLAFCVVGIAGHIPALEKLWVWANPTQKQEMLQAKDYSAFRLAAKNGQVKVIEKLWEWAATYGLKQAMLQAENYGAFRVAAEKGHIPALEKLWDWATTEQRQALLQAEGYYAFRSAAANGHVQTIEKLRRFATLVQRQALLQAENYGAFRWAAANGHVQVIETLRDWANPEQRQAMLQAKDCSAFRLAAKNGRVPVLEKLRGWATDEQRQAMFQADNYSAFRLATERFRIKVMGELWGWANPTQKQAILQADNYGAFRAAAEKGHAQVITKLWTLANLEQKQAMFQAVNYYAFRFAAANGHVQVIEKLWGWTADEPQQAMFQADNYGAFRFTAANGHVQVIEKLWGWAADEQRQAMLQANNYGAFRLAATNGHVQVIEKLWTLATPEQQQAMLQVDNYGAFRAAAEKGHAQVIEKLWGWATPEQQQAMLQADNYYVFRLAAANGHIQVIEKLWVLATPEQQQAMLQADNYYVFRLAAEKGHIQVIEKLWGWADENTKSTLVSENYHVLRPILTSVSKNTNYSKLLVDMFAMLTHMKPALCKRAKQDLIKVPSIKIPEDFDQQVVKRANAYNHLGYILRGIGIPTGNLNFEALQQTANILEIGLHTKLRLTGEAKIGLLRPLWLKEITNKQILEVSEIFNERNQNASTRGIIKHIGNQIGLNWGNSSPHAQNSPHITKVLYNLGDRTRVVSQKEVEQIFTSIMREVFGRCKIKEIAKEIAFDQFIDKIKRHSWLDNKINNPEYIKDKEIPGDDKENVKAELRKVLSEMVRSSKKSKNVSTIIKAVCDKLFPTGGESLAERLAFDDKLRVRLEAFPNIIKELAKSSGDLSEFAAILGRKLQEAKVDAKTEDKVIDNILKLVIDEYKSSKATLAMTARDRLEAGQIPTSWTERAESKRRPVVLASDPGIGLG